MQALYSILGSSVCLNITIFLNNPLWCPIAVKRVKTPAHMTTILTRILEEFSSKTRHRFKYVSIIDSISFTNITDKLTKRTVRYSYTRHRLSRLYPLRKSLVGGTKWCILGTSSTLMTSNHSMSPHYWCVKCPKIQETSHGNEKR